MIKKLGNAAARLGRGTGAALPVLPVLVALVMVGALVLDQGRASASGRMADGSPTPPAETPTETPVGTPAPTATPTTDLYPIPPTATPTPVDTPTATRPAPGATPTDAIQHPGSHADGDAIQHPGSHADGDAHGHTVEYAHVYTNGDADSDAVARGERHAHDDGHRAGVDRYFHADSCRTGVPASGGPSDGRPAERLLAAHRPAFPLIRARRGKDRAPEPHGRFGGSWRQCAGAAAAAHAPALSASSSRPRGSGSWPRSSRTRPGSPPTWSGWRRSLSAQQDLRHLGFGRLDAHLVQRQHHRRPAAHLAEHQAGRRLTDQLGTEREDLQQVLVAAVVPPVDDDARLDLEDAVAHDLPVVRDHVTAELAHQLRQAVQLVDLDRRCRCRTAAAAT